MTLDHSYSLTETVNVDLRENICLNKLIWKTLHRCNYSPRHMTQTQKLTMKFKLKCNISRVFQTYQDTMMFWIAWQTHPFPEIACVPDTCLCHTAHCGLLPKTNSSAHPGHAFPPTLPCQLMWLARKSDEQQKINHHLQWAWFLSDK